MAPGRASRRWAPRAEPPSSARPARPASGESEPSATPGAPRQRVHARGRLHTLGTWVAERMVRRRAMRQAPRGMVRAAPNRRRAVPAIRGSRERRQREHRVNRHEQTRAVYRYSSLHQACASVRGRLERAPRLARSSTRVTTPSPNLVWRIRSPPGSLATCSGEVGYASAAMAFSQVARGRFWLAPHGCGGNPGGPRRELLDARPTPPRLVAWGRRCSWW